MVFQAGRSVIRLPQLTLQRLGNGRTGLSSSWVERVPALYNVAQSQHYPDLILKSRLNAPILRRTYAQRAVSRPKAHTGRTTTAARKAPTTSKTKAAKKPAPEKTTPKAVPKAKSKAKPRITPKPKPAKKKKAKAKVKAKAKAKAKAKSKPKPKPKPEKPKKVLTEAQESALTTKQLKATTKQLKATALKRPHETPSSAWNVYLAEKMRAGRGVTGNSFAALSKEASSEYRQLTPEKVEHYNHLANQNRAANAAAHRQWIESHTPIIIYDANLARQQLRRLGVTATPLQDHRQVTGLRKPYNYFYQGRLQSGDFKGLGVVEAAKLIGREWKGLPVGEKKPFEDLAAQDLARYVQERKTVLNKDVKQMASWKL